MVARALVMAASVVFVAASACDGRSAAHGASSGGGRAGGRGGDVGSGGLGAAGARTSAAGTSGLSSSGGSSGGGSGAGGGTRGDEPNHGGAGGGAGAGFGSGDAGAAGLDPGAAAGGAPAAGSPGDGPGGGSEAGGEGSVGEFPKRPACGTTYPPNAAWCAGLPLVTISAGPILDADGSEGVSPGEDAAVVITLHNTHDQTINSPCVGLLADDPGVTNIGFEGRLNPWTIYFGIAPDQSLDFKTGFHLDAGVAPGTVIHFVAWTDLQTAGCVNGADLALSLTVAP